jgi:uncharacterized protein YraI
MHECLTDEFSLQARRRGADLKRWLTLFLGILLWVHSVGAQTGNTVQPASIYVRSGPAETYNAIGAIFQNEEVKPVNRSADGTWILVEYGRGTGWIQNEGVSWQTDLSQLPLLAADVTPTVRATQPLRLLSPTPAAAQGFVLVSDSVALVRSGPTRGYPRLGQLNPGALVEPVSRNQTGDWILIHFPDPITNLPGFGWIARDLVQWRDESVIEALPIINETNLTPTATEDASIVIPSATATASPSQDANITAPTNTEAPTLTETLAPTLTETPVPTVTLNLPTATERLIPSETPIPASATPELPTNTPETSSATLQTASEFMTNTPNQAPVTETSRIIAAPVLPSPTIPTQTPVPTLEPTPRPIEPPPDTGGPGPVIPLLALAGITVAGGLVYLGAFARAMPELRRYEQGFVRTDCPVCERGSLIVEEKRGSTFGIPSVRRTVRCNTCRSVLREKGPQHWTYAVDRLENPAIYEQFNGREITDDELKAL